MKNIPIRWSSCPDATQFSQISRLSYITGGGLDRLGQPLYVELGLVLNSDTRVLIERCFLEGAAARVDVMVKAVAAFARKRRYCRVFLPADRSGPCGWFFRQLGLNGKGSRPEYWKALMIAFQGSVNPCLVSQTTGHHKAAQGHAEGRG